MTPRPRKQCPLVIVHWEDSRQANGSWRHLRNVPEPKAVICASVGWLLHDGKEAKSLAQSFGDIGDEVSMQAAGVVEIPTTCIKSIERLEERGRRRKR